MFVFSLDGLKLRDIDKGVMGRKHSFALFHVSGKNVYRDMKQVWRRLGCVCVCDCFSIMRHM